MRARAAEVISAVPRSAQIDFLEVGCGQGQFLAEIIEQAGSRLRSAVGYDPAWRGKHEDIQAGAHIFKCNFDRESAARLRHAPNVVVSRHTIEHLSRPLEFLKNIRIALGGMSTALIFIETPSIDWILQNNAMHDFFYEHCSIFSLQSLRLALEKSGFPAASVRSVFGDQYLWATNQALAVPALEELDMHHQGKSLASAETYATHWRTKMIEAARRGRVTIWGAGAKGATFAMLMDPDDGHLDCAIDINPQKQGKFLAGSGLMILSPEDASRRAPSTIFLMNPNYEQEVRETASKLGIEAVIVPV
jgi:hypothetical protein